MYINPKQNHKSGVKLSMTSSKLKPLLILKFGGSILTIDSKFETFNEAIVLKLINPLEVIMKDFSVIIVHGAGSFGHYHAKKYNLKAGFVEESQKRGIIKTHNSMLKLNTLLEKVLLTSKTINPITFSPNSFVTTKNGSLSKFEIENIKNALKLGLTPVIFGDVVFDERLGCTILSGDKIVPYLALHLRPEKIIMLTDVDGVFDNNPIKNKSAKLLPIINLNDQELLHKISSNAESGKTRVTGQMEQKLLELYDVVKSGVETWIISGLNPNNLLDVVMKEETSIKGTKLIIE